jgi:hypothetical protein
MSDLAFGIEWEAIAEGVSHPALAGTWARLEIEVGGHRVTTVYDRRSGGTRTGVYGPVFVLAEWIVRNFWFVLSECSTAGPGPWAWIRRHSLVSAREGTSLPDLRWFRDEDVVIAEWRATTDGHLPVEFVTSGRAELDPSHVQARLSEVVDLVLERLRGYGHPDIEALRVDWDAIASASGSDAVVSRRAARLGLDAFDEHDVPEHVARLLTESADRLPEATRGDLLDAAVATARLASTMAAVADAVTRLGTAPPRLVGGELTAGLPPQEHGRAAYDHGYALARELRRRMSERVNGRVDLEELLRKLGWSTMRAPDLPSTEYDPNVKGAVGISVQGTPRLIAPPKRAQHERFLVARGLYALASGAVSQAPRLLTSAGTRFQAGSRAFAAELLAPAEALRTRIGDALDEERLDEIAEEFEVSSAVIQHQIENHALGRSPARQ